MFDYLRQLEQYPELQECLTAVLSAWALRKEAVLVTVPERELEWATDRLAEASMPALLKRVLSTVPLVLEVGDTTRAEEVLQRLEAASGLRPTLPGGGSGGLANGNGRLTPKGSGTFVAARAVSVAGSHRSLLEPTHPPHMLLHHPSLMSLAPSVQLPSAAQPDPRSSRMLVSAATEPNLLGRQPGIVRASSSIFGASGQGGAGAATPSDWGDHPHEPVVRQLLRSVVIVRFTPNARSTVCDLFNALMTFGRIDADGFSIQCMPDSIFVLVGSEKDGVPSVPRDLLGFCFMSSWISSATLELFAPHIHRISPIDLSRFEDLRNKVARVSIHPDVQDYMRRLVLVARCYDLVSSSTSAQAYANLHLAGRLRAALVDRAFLSPDHVQDVAFRTLRHRIFLIHNSTFAPKQVRDAADKVSLDDILNRILASRIHPPV
ncbi:hypothetical protein HK105_200837 [Polyrhizophydium stewartii]|uniref:magnesium chelatase n=1 Tax=Polyrhizophydium stewartii TaxID=2732419 RepID=A0ABR4NKA8_9FUNG